MVFGVRPYRWTRVVRCAMCDTRMKGKKMTSDMPNDGKYCRTCSVLCDFEWLHLIPASERSRNR
jgi:hypothetical protein